MHTRYKILKMLEEAPGQLISGGQLAEALGISRAAVWKQIAALQGEGYDIASQQGKGYLLTPGDVFVDYEIEKRLTTRVVGRPLICLPEVDSTNTRLRQLAAEGAAHGTVVVSSHQTAGRGRMARRFESPKDQGVYLSVLLRSDLPLAELGTVTLLAAVVMADTLEELTGIRPGIKWTNDIYLHGHKLCGILTEGAVEGETGRLDYLVVGMGVNLYQRPEDFPPEIRHIAGSVLGETGVRLNRAEYAACLMKHFEKWYLDGQFPQNREELLWRYREDLFFLGQMVEVHSFTETYQALAEDIDGEGRLVVRRPDGRIEALNSGEISLKLPGVVQRS